MSALPVKRERESNVQMGNARWILSTMRANDQRCTIHKRNTYTRERERKQMSKMKEWLLDKQENGDDGTGFNDYIEEEGKK